MTKKMAVFFSILIILIIAAGFLFFSVNIFLNYRSGSAAANEQFSLFLFEIKNEKEKSGYLSPDYLQKLREIVQKNTSIAAVTIKSETTTYFAYPLSSKFISSNSISPEIYISSPGLKACSENIVLNDSIDTSVNAAVYFVPPEKIFTYALYSFFIIAVGTFLAFLLLIIERTRKKQKTPVNTVEDHEASVSTKSETFENESEQNQQEEIHIEEQSESEVFTEVKPSFCEPIRPAQPRTIDPLGLFSPSTGVSWESYLETRLDAELVRAASSEQDLSLVYVRTVNLLHNHPCSKAIADMLLDSFKFRDLIFEFGTDGFICILQNYNLSQTLTICEKLYKELNTLIKSFDVNNQLVFGISTRTLRLISGIRIVKEAMQAVDKAIEEPQLPIVAFRVNAERYRKFLSEELAKSDAVSDQ